MGRLTRLLCWREEGTRGEIRRVVSSEEGGIVDCMRVGVCRCGGMEVRLR
jgi:hypothetical protein